MKKYSLKPNKACVDSAIEQQGYGYITYMEMLEKKSKTYDHIQCDRCQKFHIWKKKTLKASNSRELKRDAL